MSSNFLQRFKGKTQTLSKQGVQNILGTKNIPPVQPPLHNPRQQAASTKKDKSSMGQNVTPNLAQQSKNKTAKHSSIPQIIKTQKPQNPFLVANPFYLDEEERQRQELQRKQRQRLQQQIKKAQQAQNAAKKDPKEATKTSNYSKSVQKKNNANKQWVKLGGLGANIGGDEWAEKKRKQQKMQEFAGQVKSINAQKIKAKPDIPKPRQKVEPNTRQKALQYSKNVPKPIIRKEKQQQQQMEVQPEKQRLGQQQQLTQLQLYEMKHQQLKKMIHNQY